MRIENSCFMVQFPYAIIIPCHLILQLFLYSITNKISWHCPVMIRILLHILNTETKICKKLVREGFKEGFDLWCLYFTDLAKLTHPPHPQAIQTITFFSSCDICERCNVPIFVSAVMSYNIFPYFLICPGHIAAVKGNFGVGRGGGFEGNWPRIEGGGNRGRGEKGISSTANNDHGNLCT